METIRPTCPKKPRKPLSPEKRVEYNEIRRKRRAYASKRAAKEAAKVAAKALKKFNKNPANWPPKTCTADKPCEYKRSKCSRSDRPPKCGWCKCNSKEIKRQYYKQQKQQEDDESCGSYI